MASSSSPPLTNSLKHTFLSLSSSNTISSFTSSSLPPLKPNHTSLSTPSRIHTLHHHHPSPPNFSRRLLVIPSVSGIWDALTGGKNDKASAAAMAVRHGMFLFTQGDVMGSVVEFDKAIELDPRQKPRLWQRGLSLYYLDSFKEAAEQFRLDVSLNPNDTEESIWCFLCEAQLYGVDEARKRFLEVGRDSRDVMREAYHLFKDGGDPEKLVAAFSTGRPNEYFYASLYAGLYHESQIFPLLNQPDAAKVHILAASKSPYAERSGDYMAALAKVHCLCRNWE